MKPEIPFTEENFWLVFTNVYTDKYAKLMYSDYVYVYKTWHNLYEKHKGYKPLKKAFQEVAFKYKVEELLK